MKKLSFLVVFTILTSTVECYGIRGSFQYAKVSDAENKIKSVKINDSICRCRLHMR